MNPVWTVHTAAPPIGAVQRCGTCGHILEDWTAAQQGLVMIPEGQDRTLPWWPTGQLIAQNGPATVTLPNRPLASDERLCAGAN